ncbi:MAG: hypothetical protein KDC49_14140 [Saprospiraceae bacterium]|nr:hypothetical protein [Saprospiraceae bacterium]
MGKFQNKYRNESARAQWWNYGWNAAYFVTICTKNRDHFFGRISDGIMVLSEIGVHAWNCWHEIPQHFPFVILGEFVVMPDHVHGIIIIQKNDAIGTVIETQNFASLSQTPLQYHDWDGKTPMNHFGPQSQNLASIIRGYKIGVTKNARLINSTFQWQPRYHDHIIRNDEEFQRISNYIANNPRNWEKDHTDEYP